MEEVTYKPQKIVIVEDNDALAEIYKVGLEIIGYDCYVAHDGEKAIEIIKQENPDLVLLDLMIPKISGGDVLKQMRSSDWGQKIRVYIISNLNEDQAPQDLRDLGIEGYTVKSNLRNDDIDNLVDKILTPHDQEESVSLEG